MAETYDVPPTMRAAVITGYGGAEVLDVQQIPVPSIDAAGVLVRVEWAAANPKDVFIRKGRFKTLTGRRFPIVLGSDFAGTVAGTGPDVTHVQPGDAVWGMIQGWRGGAQAEYVAVRGFEVARRPPSLTAEQAAGVPLAALTALQSLRDLGRLKPGGRVLVNGASGGVGTFAVQIAHLLGAHVTAVCQAHNHDLVRGLGADGAIDYKQQAILDLDDRFDLFFDVFGNYSFGRVRHLLRRGGRYITTVPNFTNYREALLRHPGGPGLPGKKAAVVVVQANHADLETVGQWVEAGHLRAVIDATYALADIQQVHAHLGRKRTRGKVLIQVAD